MLRFRTRKALGIGVTSLATLTLLPLLAPASRIERLTLLVAAVPLALLFGAIAGWTPPATLQAAPVSTAAHTDAHAVATALGGHTHFHTQPDDHDAAPSTTTGSPPLAAQPSQAVLRTELGVSSVEELQHTVPR
ncbi:hypothetical protein [Kineococcus gypseus]|uniref:hypothetical protein n=1 Tax=Kineococcus gypseus TaxID=1637102 RepID=UPI003D7E638D